MNSGSEQPLQSNTDGPAAVVAPVAVPAPRRHLIRRLYDWVLHWAQTPHAVWALFLLAFAESSFFPVPPDVLLMTMAFAQPMRSFWYATVSTAGSVLGGLTGYLIGWGIWEAVRGLFIPYVFSQATFDLVVARYAEYGVWIVFTAAFTPIPYKVITITAGVCHINLVIFVLVSLVGRAGRFFLVAVLIRLCGERIHKFIDRYFNLVTVVFTVGLIGGFVIVRYWNEIVQFLRGLF